MQFSLFFFLFIFLLHRHKVSRDVFIVLEESIYLCYVWVPPLGILSHFSLIGALMAWDVAFSVLSVSLSFEPSPPSSYWRWLLELCILPFLLPFINWSLESDSFVLKLEITLSININFYFGTSRLFVLPTMILPVYGINNCPINFIFIVSDREIINIVPKLEISAHYFRSRRYFKPFSN